MPIIFGSTRCDDCQALIADTEESAVQFHCSAYPTGDWMHVRLPNPSNATVAHHIRCTFLHLDCFRTMLFTPQGRQRSQAEMNCFRRAMAWRKLDLMRIFPEELDIPGPRRVSQPSVARAATFALKKRHLGRLHMELVDMIRSYCPDAYFWNVRVSRIKRWERGDAAPVDGQILKDPECLRISLDSDGICEIRDFAIILAHQTTIPSSSSGSTFSPTRKTLSPSTPSSRMLNEEVPRATDIRVVRLDNMTRMDLTFFCGPNASSIIGGPFATGLFSAGSFEYDDSDPVPVPVNLPLHDPALEEEILWLEIRLNGDNYSMLLETRSSGVIHAGLQADQTNRPTGNIFSLRYRIRPLLLILWKGKDKYYLEHSVSFATYLEGIALKSDQKSLITGPQLSSFSPVFTSHRPAWTWAPLQYISSIVVQEQDDDPGFIGMCIYYEDGGQRFIGDYERSGDYEGIRHCHAFAPITHMYVERWVEPGQFIRCESTLVNAGSVTAWIRNMMNTNLRANCISGMGHT
ncbi:hypothetical protein FACUT_6127 [Fusarium acutatum]|uniref:Uncharacterized protein n=1 Tax=Fusarium acutatum TaxID=78861 RepID=A0A8H4JTM6_9HYPO|nr:hypothetical protein FACUT_6127 [Fusarium acutatum]